MLCRLAFGRTISADCGKASDKEGVHARLQMAVMMLIVRNPRVMGRLTVSRSMAIWGWAATAVMAAASLAFFILPWKGRSAAGQAARLGLAINF